MRRIVLCFGDSYTYGRGEYPEKSWPGRLRESLGKGANDYVYNLGVPGGTSKELLKRVAAECDARFRKPDNDKVIVICVGANDQKCTDEHGRDHVVPETQFERTIFDLLDTVERYTSKFLFVGLIPVDEKKANKGSEYTWSNENIEKYNELIRSTCKDMKASFLDVYSDFEKEEKLLSSDGIHPNKKGYDWMYGKIKDYLDKQGWI